MSNPSSAKLPSEVALTDSEERSEITKPTNLDLQVSYNFDKIEIHFSSSSVITIVSKKLSP